MKKRFENFGKYILSERTRSGLTQQELGDLIGVHSQALSNCERGIAGLPVKNLRIMHKKLGLSQNLLRFNLNKDSAIQNVELIKEIWK